MAGGVAENEGFTVGALADCRVLLVRADLDLVKRAEIVARRVICTLKDGTFDTVVAFLVIHKAKPYISYLKSKISNLICAKTCSDILLTCFL